MVADSTQKKQKASILNTIKPIRTKLKTAIDRDQNSPHQVRQESQLVLRQPGEEETMAITRTAR